ncbi:MAG: Arc family DNA-binding protein [Chloroflexota bacterium]
MPTLHVRNVPEELYERIRERAQEESRSITAEVIQLLQSALTENKQEQSKVLERIQRRRFFRPADVNAPDTTSMLRQDRAR